MKKYSGELLKILDLKGNGGLDAFPKKTLDELKAFIDDSNKRRIGEGWLDEPESYVIVREKWEKSCDDNGIFVSESHFIERIEVYPPVQ